MKSDTDDKKATPKRRRGRKPASQCPDRDKNGHFVKGNKGRPVGSRNRTIYTRQDYLEAMSGAVPPETIGKILAVQSRKALDDGDTQAAKLVMQYCAPTEKITPLTDLGSVNIADANSAKKLIQGILAGVVSGAVSADEAGKLASLVEALIRASDTEDLTADIERLKRIAMPKAA